MLRLTCVLYIVPCEEIRFSCCYMYWIFIYLYIFSKISPKSIRKKLDALVRKGSTSSTANNLEVPKNVTERSLSLTDRDPSVSVKITVSNPTCNVVAPWEDVMTTSTAWVVGYWRQTVRGLPRKYRSHLTGFSQTCGSRPQCSTKAF